MFDHVRQKYRTTPLDPVLPGSAPSVPTKWHVITGAACTGKTTLINLLAARGYRIAAETARIFFEQAMASGRTLEALRQDMLAVQLGILRLQREQEATLPPAEVIFLDRALPDSLTFHRVFGMDPNGILAECRRHQYASVFILDRLPLQRNQSLGPEDRESTRFIDDWLARDYSALGYEVVRVPVLPPEERLAFVMERLPSHQVG